MRLAIAAKIMSTWERDRSFRRTLRNLLSKVRLWPLHFDHLTKAHLTADLILGFPMHGVQNGLDFLPIFLVPLSRGLLHLLDSGVQGLSVFWRFRVIFHSKIAAVGPFLR